ncbi:GNAT family N-acetyltransferase [Candidatus Woesearchaeota archaeon]|nr:GNAT family N-acetyltransferase [Candidatus Woesearchaeota archaeon]
MLIRAASLDDFEVLDIIGINTPELKVSATEEFMDRDEFRWSIQNPNGIFLLAEEQVNKKIVGFVYVNAKDTLERPLENKYACLVWGVVVPEFRQQGIAKQLYAECEIKLKEKGITNLYCWAHAEGESKIIDFMKRQGFTEGHRYVWMDKKI